MLPRDVSCLKLYVEFFRTKYTKTKCVQEYSKAENCVRASDEKGGLKYAFESITGQE